MEGPYKRYAEEFLPRRIQYLLIGESPPYTPTNQELRYFYNYNNTSGQILLSSVSYAFLNRAFYSRRERRDNKKEFLTKLMRQRIFLLDATYEPINQIKDKKIRMCKIINAYPRLKKNINNLPMRKRAKILLIHNNVIEAIGGTLRKDSSNYKIYDIGFPRYYNDKEFKKRIKAATKS